MDRELTWILVVYVAGMVAMVIELLIPGVVMGILGFLAVCGTIIYAYTTDHTTTGTVLVVVTLMLVPCFFLVWRHVLGRLWAVKHDEKDFSATPENYDQMVGKEGIAASALRPSGTAVIDDKRCSVVTRGEMIDKGARIKVIEATGNRLTVKEA